MYKRPQGSYAIDGYAVQRILEDGANPLAVIARSIQARNSILDIGCGNGILAQILKALDKECTLDGIEPSAEAAKMAKLEYRNIHQMGLQEAKFKVTTKYDHVVLADVIEHTNDPVDTLTSASTFIEHNGCLWISVPNVAFAPIRTELLNGRWEYSDWGIIERTHIRFFTHDSLLNTIKACNLYAEEVYCLCRSPFLMEKKLQDYNVDIPTLLKLRADPLAFAYQFLVKCRASPNRLINEDGYKETWIGLEQHLVREYVRRRREAKRK